MRSPRPGSARPAARRRCSKTSHDTMPKLSVRSRRAGAIVFGKTNVPLWSGDFQTFNEMFGTTNNPWDLGEGARGFVGRCGGGGRVRHDELRDRHRHRRLGTCAGGVLWGVRPQALVRRDPDARLPRRTERRRDGERRQRVRTDRPQRRRPRPAARRARRSDLATVGRLAPGAAARRHHRPAIAARGDLVRRAIAGDGRVDDRRSR